MSRSIWLGALLVLVLGLPARAQDEIRIGAVLPVTGKESKIGGAYKQATELAVKEANDAGGVQVGGKKMKVNLSLLDDTSDAAKSAQLVEQLITQNKSHAIIGGYGSHLVQAQSVVPDRYGIPYLSGGAGATAIYGRSKWVFGTLSPVEHLAETQMAFLDDLVKQGKLKTPLTIALVTENTEHGNDYAKGVNEFVKTHPGYKVVLQEKFELNTTDYRPLLQRVAEAKADLLPGRLAPRGLHRHAPDVHPDGAAESDADPRGARLGRRGAEGARTGDRLHLRQRLVVGPPALPPGQGVQHPLQGGDRRRAAVVPRDGLRDDARAADRHLQGGLARAGEDPRRAGRSEAGEEHRPRPGAVLHQDRAVPTCRSW